MEDKRLPGKISEAEEQKEFEQLIHTIVANQELWYLSRGEEFLLTEDEWGDKLPLWPTAAEAAVNGTQEWEGCVAESVSLAEFLYQWIPFLKEENLGVSLGWKHLVGSSGGGYRAGGKIRAVYRGSGSRKQRLDSA